MDQNNTDEELDDIRSEQESNKTYDRPPELEGALVKAMAMPVASLLGAIQVRAHTSPQFIPSEVLVSLVRLKFGSPPVQKAVALALNERIVRVTRWYLRKNAEWLPVIDRSSESLKELVNDLWLKLLGTRAAVSFAEVRFLPYLECRILDWLKSQLRIKNSVPAAEALEAPTDEDGATMSLVDQVPDDDVMPVQDQVELKQLLRGVERQLLKLPKSLRDAVYYCYELELSQEDAAKLMKCSDRSVRTYLKKALEVLRKGE